ncbi:sigma-70 family RNA polymerase sigma factor [bacterium]|nr:sigma-70 family RNA polymerase sigma factor [bacterium]
MVTVSFVLPYLTWAFDAGSYAISQPHFLRIAHLGKALTIPEKIGVINQGFQGNGKIVVHIQDLHCNYEVQMNIAKTIHHLAKEYGLKLVGEEGAFHTVNTAAISDFPIKQAREQVSDYFVRQGKLTGAEFYAAIGEYPIRLEGIETPALYEAGQQAVRSFLNAESQGYCYDLREMLAELKATLYNPRLKQFDARRVAWREGSLDLLKYCVHLYTSACKLKLELGAYPQLARFVSLNQNFFSLGINSDQLFQELDKLDTVIRQQLYTSEPQRELDILCCRLDIVEKLLNISVSADELAEFRVQREKYSMKEFINFINQVGAGSHARPTEEIILGPEIHILDEYLQQVDDFYRLADERSTQFVDNLIRKMNRFGEKLSVMITGGFHTDQVLAELKRRDITYVSITPGLTRQDVINPYFSLLQNQQTPLEKLLAKNQNIMAVRTLLVDSNLPTVLQRIFADKLGIYQSMVALARETGDWSNILNKKESICIDVEEFKRVNTALMRQNGNQPLNSILIPMTIAIPGQGNLQVIACPEGSKLAGKLGDSFETVKIGGLEYVFKNSLNEKVVLKEILNSQRESIFAKFGRLAKNIKSVSWAGLSTRLQRVWKRFQALAPFAKFGTFKSIFKSQTMTRVAIGIIAVLGLAGLGWKMMLLKVTIVFTPAGMLAAVLALSLIMWFLKLSGTQLAKIINSQDYAGEAKNIKLMAGSETTGSGDRTDQPEISSIEKKLEPSEDVLDYLEKLKKEILSHGKRVWLQLLTTTEEQYHDLLDLGWIPDEKEWNENRGNIAEALKSRPLSIINEITFSNIGSQKPVTVTIELKPNMIWQGMPSEIILINADKKPIKQRLSEKEVLQKIRKSKLKISKWMVPVRFSPPDVRPGEGKLWLVSRREIEKIEKKKKEEEAKEKAKEEVEEEVEVEVEPESPSEQLRREFIAILFQIQSHPTTKILKKLKKQFELLNDKLGNINFISRFLLGRMKSYNNYQDVLSKFDKMFLDFKLCKHPDLEQLSCFIDEVGELRKQAYDSIGLYLKLGRKPGLSKLAVLDNKLTINQIALHYTLLSSAYKRIVSAYAKIDKKLTGLKFLENWEIKIIKAFEGAKIQNGKKLKESIGCLRQSLEALASYYQKNKSEFLILAETLGSEYGKLNNEFLKGKYQALESPEYHNDLRAFFDQLSTVVAADLNLEWIDKEKRPEKDYLSLVRAVVENSKEVFKYAGWGAVNVEQYFEIPKGVMNKFVASLVRAVPIALLILIFIGNGISMAEDSGIWHEWNQRNRAGSISGVLKGEPGPSLIKRTPYDLIKRILYIPADHLNIILPDIFLGFGEPASGKNQNGDLFDNLKVDLSNSWSMGITRDGILLYSKKRRDMGIFQYRLELIPGIAWEEDYISTTHLLGIDSLGLSGQEPEYLFYPEAWSAEIGVELNNIKKFPGNTKIGLNVAYRREKRFNGFGVTAQIIIPLGGKSRGVKESPPTFGKETFRKASSVLKNPPVIERLENYFKRMQAGKTRHPDDPFSILFFYAMARHPDNVAKWVSLGEKGLKWEKRIIFSLGLLTAVLGIWVTPLAFHAFIGAYLSFLFLHQLLKLIAQDRARRKLEKLNIIPTSVLKSIYEQFKHTVFYVFLALPAVSLWFLLLAPIGLLAPFIHDSFDRKIFAQVLERAGHKTVPATVIGPEIGKVGKNLRAFWNRPSQFRDLAIIGILAAINLIAANLTGLINMSLLMQSLDSANIPNMFVALIISTALLSMLPKTAPAFNRLAGLRRNKTIRPGSGLALNMQSKENGSVGPDKNINTMQGIKKEYKELWYKYKIKKDQQAGTLLIKEYSKRIPGILARMKAKPDINRLFIDYALIYDERIYDNLIYDALIYDALIEIGRKVMIECLDNFDPWNSKTQFSVEYSRAIRKAIIKYAANELKEREEQNELADIIKQIRTRTVKSFNPLAQERKSNQIKNLLKMLPPRAEYIIWKKIVVGKTLKEIEKDLYISRERVRDIILMSLEFIRRVIAADTDMLLSKPTEELSPAEIREINSLITKRVRDSEQHKYRLLKVKKTPDSKPGKTLNSIPAAFIGLGLWLIPEFTLAGTEAGGAASGNIGVFGSLLMIAITSLFYVAIQKRDKRKAQAIFADPLTALQLWLDELKSKSKQWLIEKISYGKSLLTVFNLFGAPQFNEQQPQTPKQREYNVPIREHNPILDRFPSLRRAWILLLGAAFFSLTQVGSVCGMQTPDLPSDKEINSHSDIIALKYEYGAKYDFLEDFNPDRIKIKVLEKKAVGSWRYYISRFSGIPVERLIGEDKDELEIYVLPQMMAALNLSKSKPKKQKNNINKRLFLSTTSLAKLHLGHTMRYQAVMEDTMLRRALRFARLMFSLDNLMFWHGGDHVGDRLKSDPTVSDYLKEPQKQHLVNPTEMLRIFLNMVKEAETLGIKLEVGLPSREKLEEWLQDQKYYSEKAGIGTLLDILEKGESGIVRSFLSEFEAQDMRDMAGVGVADVVMAHYTDKSEVSIAASRPKLENVKSLSTIAAPQAAELMLKVCEAMLPKKREDITMPEAFQARLTHFQKALNAMNAEKAGALIKLDEETSQVLAAEIAYLDKQEIQTAELGPEFARKVVFVSSPTAEIREIKVNGKTIEIPGRTVAEIITSEKMSEIKSKLAKGLLPIKKFKGRRIVLPKEKHSAKKLGTAGRWAMKVAKKMPGFRTVIHITLQWSNSSGYQNYVKDRLLETYRKSTVDLMQLPMARDLFLPGGKLYDKRRHMAVNPWQRKKLAQAQGEFVRAVVRYIYRYEKEAIKDKRETMVDEHLDFFNALMNEMNAIVITKEAIATYGEKKFLIPAVLLGRGHRGALGYLLDLLRTEDKDGTDRGTVNEDKIREIFRRLFKLRIGAAA